MTKFRELGAGMGAFLCVATMITTCPQSHASSSDLKPTGNVVFWASGEPVPKIVTAADSTPVERFAASELQTYWQKMTGFKPEIAHSYQPDEKAIVIGRHSDNASLEWNRLDPDEYVIDISEKAIRIAGGTLSQAAEAGSGERLQERGTLYGVYDLLEKLGVRWYRPEEWGEHVPKVEEIVLLKGRAKETPAYQFRSGISTYCWWQDQTPEQSRMAQLWATRNRLNTNMNTPPELGGFYKQGFYHSYGEYVPQGKFYQTNPEYFALIDGKRSSDPHAQLCLSNPAVFEIVVEAIVASAKKNPNIEVASLDPNDFSLWCECEECKKLDDPLSKDASGISMSNRVCKFNNRVAKAVAERVPGVKIGWLAYLHHSAAPTQVEKFEPNTMVQVAAYAGGFSDYSKKLEDPASAANQKFLKILKAYGDLTTVGVYDYWSDYAWPGPLPLMRVMSDRLKQYRRYNVKGVYSEMHPGWGPQGISLYFFPRLLWDPDRDLKGELDEYYSNYYGPAAKWMKEYHEALETAADGGPYYGSGGSEIGRLFTKELIDRLQPLMDKALESVKGQEPYARRLDGFLAGHEFARKYQEMIALKEEAKPEEASARLGELKKFFLSQPTGEVFENGPKFTQAVNNSFMVFAELEKELSESVLLFRELKNARLLQQHDSGWRFKIDPKDEGRDNQWNLKNFNDAQWPEINTTGWWQSQGFPDYHGVAWYRKKIDPPVALEGKKTILHFGAVDGDAEVYIDGEKIGERLLGPQGQGYDQPFFFDLSKHIRKDDPVVLSIRVRKDFAMGGIVKGVKIYQVDDVAAESVRNEQGE